MSDGAETKETKMAHWAHRFQWSLLGREEAVDSMYTRLSTGLPGRLLSGADTSRIVPSGHWVTSLETFPTGKERWASLPPVESHFQ